MARGPHPGHCSGTPALETEQDLYCTCLESGIVHLHVLQGAGLLQLLPLQLLHVVHGPPVNLQQFIHGIQHWHCVQTGSPGGVGLDMRGEAERAEFLVRNFKVAPLNEKVI